MADPAVPTESRTLASRVGVLFPVRVVRRFLQDDCGTLAVFIAWNVLTAVFPIVLILVAVGGAVLSVAGISSDTIERAVVTVFPADAGAQDAALSAIVGIRHRTGLFAILAFIGFLWSASLLFGAIELTFRTVFRMSGRSFLDQKLMAMGMMAIFVVLSLVAIGTSAVPEFVNQISNRPLSPTEGPAARALQVAIGAGSAFLLFLVIYVVVPTRRPSLGAVWPGALSAALAFEALSQLFPLYIRLNPGINQYGRPFTLLFVLLAFSYLLGIITLLGAEVVAVRELRTAAADR